MLHPFRKQALALALKVRRAVPPCLKLCNPQRQTPDAGLSPGFSGGGITRGAGKRDHLH
jgi:hypothetical protein